VALSCYREPVYVSWSNSVDQDFPEAVYIDEILWQLVLSYKTVVINAWGISTRLISQLSFTQSSWICAFKVLCSSFGAFAKLGKAAVIFVISCLLAWNISAYSRRISMTFDIWEYLGKIPVSLKSDKDNGHFTWRHACTFMYLAELLSEWEVFQTKLVEKMKTNILCLTIPPPPQKFCLFFVNFG